MKPKITPNVLKQKFSLSITPAVQAESAKLASDKGMSLSMFIEQLLRQEIEKSKAAQQEQQHAAANARRR